MVIAKNNMCTLLFAASPTTDKSNFYVILPISNLEYFDCKTLSYILHYALFNDSYRDMSPACDLFTYTLSRIVEVELTHDYFVVQVEQFDPSVAKLEQVCGYILESLCAFDVNALTPEQYNRISMLIN